KPSKTKFTITAIYSTLPKPQGWPSSIANWQSCILASNKSAASPALPPVRNKSSWYCRTRGCPAWHCQHSSAQASQSHLVPVGSVLEKRQ
uniref:Uncharacterized protein n=1 Tax=Geospiza parvula TaxID=87175 RepID=A0A8U8BYC0_GEOPR